MMSDRRAWLETEEFLSDLRALLEEAGTTVSAFFHGEVEVSQKEDGSPITEADVKVNDLLIAGLSKWTPEFPILSEESQDDPIRFESEYVWIIDPIDGTKEFVEKRGELSISIGLAERGRVIAGGVFNPITLEGGVCNASGKVEFWGFDRYGAVASKLQDAMISVSRSETEKGMMEGFLESLPPLTPVGSIAYKLLRVAAGRDDLTFTIGGRSEWDICGGIALVLAKGKIAKTLEGNKIRFNRTKPRIFQGIIAGSPELVEECTIAIKQVTGE